MDHNAACTNDALRLITSHQSALLAYILTLHRNLADAQDILQETNLVLWQKFCCFEQGTNFKAWAFRIAYLQTMAYFKRNHRGSWLGFSPELVDVLAKEAEPLLCDFEQRQQALRRCIERLPPSDRDILQAHYEGGRALAEIGANLGRTVGALKQVLLRIRRSLKSCIEGQLKMGEDLHG
jgi:RNA polymerase sigma-70 factor, ECF subfamily